MSTFKIFSIFNILNFISISAQPIGYKIETIQMLMGTHDNYLTINNNETNILNTCANKCNEMDYKCQFFSITSSSYINTTTCVFYGARPCQYKTHDNLKTETEEKIYEKIAPIIVKPGVFRTFCYSTFFGNVTNNMSIFSPLEESIEIPDLPIRNYTHQGLVHNSSAFQEECTLFCNNNSCAISRISVKYEQQYKGFIYNCMIFDSTPFEQDSQLYFDATFYGMCSPYVEDTITIHKETISHVCNSNVATSNNISNNIMINLNLILLFIILF